LAVQAWAWYHLQAGDSALARFETTPAKVHLQKCLSVWPRSAVAHLLASRAERRAGEFVLAEQHLDQCRKYADAEISEAAAFEWALQRAAMGDLDTVEQSLQARLLKTTGPRGPAISRRDPSKPCRLSFAQEQLWFLDQVQPGTATYNIAEVLRLRGRLALQVRVDAVGFALASDGYVQRIDAYREEAERDFLTGIYNRRLAMRLLEKEIRRTRRTRSPLSLLLIDVDNFKAFNDTCGHLAGDDVLRVLARIVTHAARSTDVVGRFGGEEFMVVLPDTPVENAVVLAERLRADVEKFGREHVTQWRGRPPTISIGVCAVSPRDDSEAAIGRCDRALYESKHRGRNCFSIGLSDEDAP
jgi:diguanylate cyclase (GGDEF)-like protein